MTLQSAVNRRLMTVALHSARNPSSGGGKATQRVLHTFKPPTPMIGEHDD